MKLCPKCQKHFSDDANFCPVDAARLVPLETQATGSDSLSARFDLGPRLGASHTGTVYRATDKTTGQTCVVKLVSPAVVALPGVAQRLERELKQLERVQSQGVAKVITSSRRPSSAGEETWLAMELLDGATTLHDAITARGPIDPEQAAHLIEVIGEALIEAAQVGVVHRDLAPKNVIFAGQDIKLINFSLPTPTTDKVPGVPEFIAPEQVEGRPVDQRSNLYSLGALYYYVLTGQTVFSGSPEEVHRQHVAGNIRPPSQLAPAAAPLEAVIMRALDRSPTKRFLTVRQFVDEVMRVGHGEVIELKNTMAMGRVGKPKGDLVQTLLGVKGGALAALAQKSTMLGGTFNAGTAATAPAPSIPAAPAAAAPSGHNGPPQMPAPLPSQPAQPIGMAAAFQAAPMGMQPLTPPPQAPAAPTASPWAPPVASAALPQEAPPMVQAPVVPAAPVLAAPNVAAMGAPSGKKRSEDAKGNNKSAFRETMWFKKGDLDAQAAIAAAEERARTGKDASADKADSLPIDERYKDDGSITRGDKEKYSLRTGGTQMMASLKDRGKASQSLAHVDEDALVAEMKKGRQWIFIAIGLGVVGLVVLIVLIAS